MSTGSKETNTTKKRKKRKKKKKFSLLTFFKIFIILIIVGGIVGSGVTYFYVKNVLKDIPQIDPSKINDLLGENSVILDSNGKVLETIQNSGLRTIIKYDDISKNTINAYIAVEDKTFWEHNGFNYIRLMGAIRDSVFRGKSIKGTSTISQQLARNLYLAEIKSVRSIERKIKEAYYAMQLENYLTKEQIIEAYLNTIYLGSGTNGVEAAAHKYFNKDAKDLDLIESAILAGIPANPLDYSPMRTVKKANVESSDYIIDDSSDLYSVIYNPGCEKRFKTVISIMYNNGHISKSEYEKAKQTDLKTVLHFGSTTNNEISSYFSDMVKNNVLKDLMVKYNYTRQEAQHMLYTKGLKIYSTIDFDMQKTLESAYSNKNLTAYYGASTVTAVKNFQSRNGLKSDGIAGSGTIQKLIDLGLVKKEDFSLKTYRKGLEHDDVIILKKALDSLGLMNYNDNIPKVTVRFNKQKNIITKEGTILLYKYDNFVNSKNQFIIPSSDYKYDENGNLVLFKNKRLYFYPKKQDGKLINIQAVLKTTYKYDKDNKANTKNSNGTYNIIDLYTYQGKDLLIKSSYKSFDNNKNLVINKKLFNDNPNFFNKDTNGNLLVNSDNYVITTKGVIQPQSSMVIIDYHSGELKAIVGGRNVEGSMIYNRAIKPRQPGSSIKPIGVYLPAIDSKNYTSSTVIDDRPTFLGSDPEVRWPLNWYEHSHTGFKYWGLLTLREGIEWSNNVISVKLANMIGVETSISYLKKLGITSLVESGRYNDYNLSSVALGGMTQGISPLEMAQAYGALANKGVLNKTITYTKVLNNNNEVILQTNSKKTLVVDEKSAYIVQDMMRTGVDHALSTGAQIRTNNKGIPVAGKTGTTSNKLDAWFVGYTPYYVASIWFGNDWNMPLNEGSHIAAKFWSQVMKEIHTDLPDKDFVKPNGIVYATVDTKSGKLPSELSYLDPRGTVKKEIFIKGTVPTETDDVHVKAAIDVSSGKLATEYCPTTLVEEKVFIKRPEPYDPNEFLDKDGNPILLRDSEYDLPTEFCDLHQGELIDINNINNSSTSNIHYIVQLPDKTYKVLVPFYVEKTSREKVLVPIDTIIMLDSSMSMPDGSVILPYDLKYYPNLDSLKGTINTNKPSTENTTPSSNSSNTNTSGN
ncbi:transglycosylase domain-containing protein [Helicovermis profundi]|uniref:Penicillin-binding protein 1A n=1 Tax=Helicovermis profundi TaxID=3065157 RepID=A0AAU9E957_9FIRM|nr:hypothetical protein HLPR_23140 [Clostridia bacterium S502]